MKSDRDVSLSRPGATSLCLSGDAERVEVAFKTSSGSFQSIRAPLASSALIGEAYPDDAGLDCPDRRLLLKSDPSPGTADPDADLLPERLERLEFPAAPGRGLLAALSRSEVPVRTALLCASSFSINSLLITNPEELSLVSVDVSASGVF